MLQRLPETADFIKQVERQVSIEGLWPVAELDRLTDLVSDTTGDLVARLEFDRYAGFNCLRGTLEATLKLTCQRCMQAMDYRVSATLLLGLVKTEDEADELPSDMEPYLIDGDEQSIIDLLEDELLLSLPIAPTHEQDCSRFLEQQEKRRQAEKMESSPFAVLKGIKLD